MKVFLIIMILMSMAYPKISGYKFEKLTKDVYVIHGPIEEPNVKNQGFMNNPALIVAKKGLIIVDPGGTYQTGKMVLREVKKISNKKIVAVFNTHVHGDHWLGNQAIKEAYPNVKIYANKSMIRQAKAGLGKAWLNIMNRSTRGISKDTKIVFPNNTVKHLQHIMAGGDEFIIHNPLPNAHTNTDIVLEHKRSQTIFMGDNAFYLRLGRFDGTSSMINNIKLINYIAKLNKKYFVPGHGKSGDFKSSMKPFLTYLNMIYAEAKKAYDDDVEIFEIKSKLSKKFHNYHSWAGYEEKFGVDLAKMKSEIEALDF